MRTSPVTFTFEYRINGMVAAEFDCRATADAHLGKPAYTPRGEYAPIDPPEPPEVWNFEDIEVEVIERQATPGERDQGAGYFIRTWIAPDEHLRSLILDWLADGNADDDFLDRLAEDMADEADRRAEYRAELRREQSVLNAAE